MKFKEFLKEEVNSQQEACKNFLRKFERIKIYKESNATNGSFEFDIRNRPDKQEPIGDTHPHRVYDLNTGEAYDILEGLFDEDGKVREYWRKGFRLELWANSHQNLDWKNDFPGLTEYTRLNVALSDYDGTSSIDNFHNWPKVQFLRIEGFVLKSLAGIENTPLRTLRFIFNKIDELQCGLLRVLKCPELTGLKINLHDESMEVSDGIDAMTEIIEKHLENHDIAECIDELIEAGFKQYAKM
jgi:hypothetical protein